MMEAGVGLGALLVGGEEGVFVVKKDLKDLV